MLSIIFILFAVIFLSYSNGANDNFKTVATLWGSKTTDYKKAIYFATITTLLGSFTALFISHKLIVIFSGKYLVPDEVVNNSIFLISVGLGAALTVFIATITGFPISTTHALIGALIGAGLLSGTKMNFHVLSNNFLMPMLLSPVISIFLTLVIYPCFKFIRVKLGIECKMCICTCNSAETIYVPNDNALILNSSVGGITIDQVKNCQQYYQSKILGFDSKLILDKLHYISAGSASFARGLNDTPKIVALLLVMNTFSLKFGIFIVAFVMAAGALLNAKKVALTMSKRITEMNNGQGFTANFITSFLVIFSSKLGLPVSTTHISCGSIFGIGLANKKANIYVIKKIIFAWIFTLPVAGIFAGTCFFMLNL